MYRLRAALLATVAFAGPAAAQNTDSLPTGLVRQGNVVMMAPIGDFDEAARGPAVTGEHRIGLVRVLSAQDHDLYSHAFEAADRGDWIAARGLADQGHDPIARLVIQWRYLLDRNSGATFAEISEFLKNYSDWPNRDTLFARAERAIDPGMEPHAVIAWFGERAPVSDIGKVRLGEALIATGSVSRGRDLIHEGWIDGNFEPQQEFAIIQRDGAYLTPDIDRERMERLIARNDLSGARREMSRVTSSDQRIADARLALRSNPASGERLVADLPDMARDDPGLIFDRTRLARQKLEIGEIPKLILRAPTREMAKINPARWWEELNLDTREAIKATDYASAYAIASHSGLTAGDGLDYSEAQFLAGWIALRFLKDPATALTHSHGPKETLYPYAMTRPIQSVITGLEPGFFAASYS